MTQLKRALLLSGAALCLLGAALAQRGRARVYNSDDDEPPIAAREAEFHFIRVEYTDLPEYHRGFGYASRDGQGSVLCGHRVFTSRLATAA